MVNFFFKKLKKFLNSTRGPRPLVLASIVKINFLIKSCHFFLFACLAVSGARAGGAQRRAERQHCQCVACYVEPGHRSGLRELNNITTLTYSTYSLSHWSRPTTWTVCRPARPPWSPQLVKQRKLETGDRRREVERGSFTWYTQNILHYSTLTTTTPHSLTASQDH